MPRPKQYTRVRRIAMQIVMWCAFLAALGLAGLVSRHKRAGIAVSLAAPSRAGSLVIQLPAFWKVSKNVVSGATVVTATEFSRQQQYPRVLQISQERFSAAAPAVEDYLRAQLADQPNTTPFYFQGLHVRGLQAVVQPGDENPQTQPGVYACAVVPLDSGQSLGVFVSLELQYPVTPNDHDLLSQVAATLTLARNDSQASR